MIQPDIKNLGRLQQYCLFVMYITVEQLFCYIREYHPFSGESPPIIPIWISLFVFLLHMLPFPRNIINVKCSAHLSICMKPVSLRRLTLASPLAPPLISHVIPLSITKVRKALTWITGWHWCLCESAPRAFRFCLKFCNLWAAPLGLAPKTQWQ